jgi:hypothetical protein
LLLSCTVDVPVDREARTLKLTEKQEFSLPQPTCAVVDMLSVNGGDFYIPYPLKKDNKFVRVIYYNLLLARQQHNYHANIQAILKTALSTHSIAQPNG